MGKHPAPIPATQAPPVPTIERSQLLALSVEAGVDITTAARAVRGAPVRSTTKARLVAAAKKLRLVLPSLALATVSTAPRDCGPPYLTTDGAGGVQTRAAGPVTGRPMPDDNDPHSGRAA